jgi:hypothetical protein
MTCQHLLYVFNIKYMASIIGESQRESEAFTWSHKNVK